MKNYNLYEKKIQSFAKICGTKILPLRKAKEPKGKLVRAGTSFIQDCGECDAYRRIIYIDTNLSASAKVAVLLHEVGHLYDNFYNPDTHSLHSAYRKYLRGKKITLREKRLIVDCEKSAWRQGKSIAQLLKIPLGQWFDREMKEGLSHYKTLKTAG